MGGKEGVLSVSAIIGNSICEGTLKAITSRRGGPHVSKRHVEERDKGQTRTQWGFRHDSLGSTRISGKKEAHRIDWDTKKTGHAPIGRAMRFGRGLWNTRMTPHGGVKESPSHSMFG